MDSKQESLFCIETHACVLYKDRNIVISDRSQRRTRSYCSCCMDRSIGALETT